jgi:dGTPase
VSTDHRLPYERDRDRIYHSTAFRKLKDKTQVFMFEKGDYYRNRLTHTLEVSQIARSVSRKFQLNEDLAECISLCHDLGHSPFGHVGEDIISQELDHNFDHNIQSFRQVTLLEKKYVSYDGLNLSWETLDGLIKHNGPIQDPIHEYDLSPKFSFNLNKYPSLEAQIASISDDIAYIAHDFDDGIRSEILSLKKLSKNNILFEFIDFDYLFSLENKVARNYFTRQVINYLVLNLIEETELRLKNSNLKSYDDIINSSEFYVGFSANIQEKVTLMKSYLFEHFYTSDFVYNNRTHAETILVFIINFLKENISELPSSWQKKITNEQSKKQTIVDYVCGMTDQYAINFYKNYASKN